MIEKGYVYKKEPDDEDVVRLYRDEDDALIFEVKDEYIVDVMAADVHTDTIVLVLKRKEDKNG